VSMWHGEFRMRLSLPEVNFRREFLDAVLPDAVVTYINHTKTFTIYLFSSLASKVPRCVLVLS